MQIALPVTKPITKHEEMSGKGSFTIFMAKVKYAVF